MRTSTQDTTSSQQSIYALPKKRNRIEAKVDGKVNEWFHRHWHKSYALEVKVGKNKLIEHQEKALKKVAQGKFSHKLPDTGRRNPFDYVGLINADAIVCVVAGKDVRCIVNNVHTVSFSLQKTSA